MWPDNGTIKFGIGINGINIIYFRAHGFVASMRGGAG
jgi:hypothetical protein